MTREIDWEKVDQLLIAGCNGVQTAAAIGVYPDTLYLHCEKQKKCSFTAYLQSKRSHGDGLLHAAQYQKAIKEKNPTMLIWLGKQRLNQKETHDIAPTNDKVLDMGLEEIKCIDIDSMKELIEKQAKELNELRAKIEGRETHSA